MSDATAIRWNWQRNNTVRVRAPVDVAQDGTRTALVTASIQGSVFDRAFDGIVAAEVAEGETSVQTALARDLVAGDTVRAFLDDGTAFVSLVASVDSVAGTIELASAVPAGRSIPAGAALAKRLGPGVLFVGYNLAGADPSTSDWGYAGEFARAWPGLRPGMRIRVEVSISENAANGLEWFDALVVGPGSPVA